MENYIIFKAYYINQCYMGLFSRHISKLAILEAFIAATSEEIFFGQQFDLPKDSIKDNITREVDKQEGLTLEEQFNSFHYKGYGFNDVEDKHGVKVYYASELKRLLFKEIPMDYSQAFKSLRNKENKPIFDARDIVKFYLNAFRQEDLIKAKNEIRVISRKSLLNELYKQKYIEWKRNFRQTHGIFCNKENFKTLYSLSLVKRSFDYFKDTDKPNLLITYPVLDEEKAFFSPAARELIKTLSESYDVWFATARNEKDFYKAIKKAPRIDLLVISGHGSKENILLNQPVNGFEEMGYIDVEDNELRRYFRHLSKEATIFLNACSTGMGKEDVKNLANTIAKNAPGRTIFAATEPFSIQEVIINKPFPLELEIPEKTYITKK